ncbi:hypothetical protein HQ571_02200 [Candidatus Kuenenbacteria bacterium]|nr:hypothetical protein [Candidatus Kuenenbacteria bacterium]
MYEQFLMWFGRIVLIITIIGLVPFALKELPERFFMLLLASVLLVVVVGTFVPRQINYLRYPPVIKAMNTPAPDQISRCLEGKSNIPICHNGRQT